MNCFFKMRIIALWCIVASLAVFTACGGNDAAEGELSGTVQVDGSSTVYPITEAVAEEFMIANSGVRVTVGVSGTGGGFSKFLRGETDVNNASRVIDRIEIDLAEQNGIGFIELPVAYDGLAVMVNPSNDWVECLTADELRRIWEPGSTVDAWNEVRSEFPDRELALYGPGTDSGTYDYFTEAVVGESGASRSDFTASEDDNVLVQGVAGDPNALGYFGLAYYENNADRLKLIPIDDEDPSNGDGCIEPTSETVETGTYAPLSRPLFIYVKEATSDNPVVHAFVEFYLENAAALAPDVGYVRLSDEAYDLALERYGRGVTGSMFADEAHTGVTMAELLRRELDAEGEASMAMPDTAAGEAPATMSDTVAADTASTSTR